MFFGNRRVDNVFRFFLGVSVILTLILDKDRKENRRLIFFMIVDIEVYGKILVDRMK